MQLFADQIAPVEQVIENLKQNKTVLLYAATGSGKTVMACEVVRRMNMKTIFIVNRQVLVHQSYDTLSNFKLSPSIFHNIIKKTPSGEVMNQNYKKSKCLISLIETIENGEINFEPELIIIDEAHKATSFVYQEYRKKFPNALIVGLSASPKRQKNKEGESLVDWYDVMVTGLSVKELISCGRLATPVYKIFSENEHAVNTWKIQTKHSENKRTIVFTKDTKHSLAVKEAFINAGVNAEIITAGSDIDSLEETINTQTPNQRNEIFNKFHSGKIEVLISVSALCEGFDEKLAKYCMLLRKVGFISLYHQMVGRVLRAHPSKPEGFVLDFCGNFDQHGRIEDYIWNLEDDEKEISTVVSDGAVINFGNFNKKQKLFINCKECNHVYDSNIFQKCNCCGTYNVVKVSATLKQLKDKFMVDVDSGKWNKFARSPFMGKKDTFDTFVEILERAVKSERTQKFNEMYVDVFVDGKLKNELRWLEQLFGKKKKFNQDSKIEFTVI